MLLNRDFPTRDLHPFSSCPCWAYTNACRRTSESLRSLSRALCNEGKMKPIFIVHAREYLVATEIEKRFKNLRVWVPSKDTGIDLLVTNSECRKTISIQVKFSKDFFGNIKKTEATENLKSRGWWTFDKEKINKSPANFWILVLYKFQNREYDFVIIKPKALLSMYDSITPDSKKIQSYVWVTDSVPSKCWETRGLQTKDQIKISQGMFKSKDRELTKYLNNWQAFESLNAYQARVVQTQTCTAFCK